VIETKTITNLVRAAGIEYVRVYRHNYKKGGGKIKLYCCSKVNEVQKLLDDNSIKYKSITTVIGGYFGVKSTVVYF